MTIPPSHPVRILTVCSHNRTRSVMMAAMLGAMLDERLGVGAAKVRSSGFGPIDLPAIDAAVEAMRRRGLDVSAHRSRATTAVLVDGADLILTAERDHVVKVAGLSRSAFRRSLTLPEFLDSAARSDLDAALDLRAWVQALTEHRTAGGYLRAAIPEVADPTGWQARAFDSAVVALEQQCREATTHVARASGPRAAV